MKYKVEMHWKSCYLSKWNARCEIKITSIFSKKQLGEYFPWKVIGLLKSLCLPDGRGREVVNAGLATFFFEICTCGYSSGASLWIFRNDNKNSAFLSRCFFNTVALDYHLPIKCSTLSKLSVEFRKCFFSVLWQWGKCCWYIQHDLYSVPHTRLNISCMLVISA